MRFIGVARSFRVPMVEANLPLYILESRIPPLIGWLDIVVGVGVEPFIRRHELIELVQDEEYGIQLLCVVHKGMESRIVFVFVEA